MVSELPEGVRWTWVPAFTPRSYFHWVPTTDELEHIDDEYKTAMELVDRFPDNPHQASYAALLREKLSKEQEKLICEVLDYQVAHGFITFKQHREYKYYCPLKEMTTPKPDF